MKAVTRAMIPTVAITVVAGILLLGATESAASPLEIHPAPMLWAMPPVELDGVGIADFFAARDLGLCSSCNTCEFETLSALFASPGPLGRVSGCGIVVQDSLIEMTRLETIRLEGVGSRTTVPVDLRSVVFTRGGMIVQPIFACEGTTSVTSLRLQAAVGTMTIQRDSETGGTFDLRFNVLVDLTLRRGWPPSSLTTRLGPYSVAMENIKWRYQTAALPFCESCVGRFSVEWNGLWREPFILRGYGTSVQLDDPIHLENSWFTMPLFPACSVRPTAVHASSWTTIKKLFR